MILVIGATGYLGSEISGLLTKEGKSVRAMVRETSDKKKIDHLRQMGVEIIKGDIRDPSSFSPALEGVEVVITTISAMPFSYVPGENDMERVDLWGIKKLIDAAVNARVHHFIYTSFSKQIDLHFPLSDAKREAEVYLQKSGLTYTILRPSYFMETWFTGAVGFDVENAKIQLCGEGTNPVSYISFKDVAKFTTESLNNPAAKDAILELGGPDQLSQLDAVKIFEDKSRKTFEVQTVPSEVLHSQFNEATDPMQKSFTGLMLCLAKGDAINMDETLKVFPIELTSVKDFAKHVVGTVSV